MPAKYIFLGLSLFAQLLLIIPKTPSANPASGLIPHLDKVVHYAIFALTTWAILRFAQTFKTSKILVAGSLIFVWAILTEVIQSFYSTRSADLWDLLADAIGIAAGIGLYLLEIRSTAQVEQKQSIPKHKQLG